MLSALYRSPHARLSTPWWAFVCSAGLYKKLVERQFGTV
jgi:hypothetical protein